MGLANVNLTDTFDQQRVKINQGLLYLNQQNLLLNLTFDTTNSAYDMANANYTVTNAAYTMANANYTVTNSAFGKINSAYTVVNAAYGSVNAAFVVANAAFDNVNTSVIAANNYAGFMANSSNNFAGAMANSGNSYALSIDTASNTAAYGNIRVSTTAANAYTDVANAAAYANIRVSTTAANAYALSIDTASNTAAYANIQATGAAANAYALSIDTASNTAAYANIQATGGAANAYALSIDTASNTAAYANIQATGGAANAYALATVTTANTAAYANIRVSTTAANTYALSIDTASNTAAYANIQATGGAANAYALATVTTANNAAHANIRVSTTAANTYANVSFYTIANGEAAFGQANAANTLAASAYSLAQQLGGNAANSIITNQVSFDTANAAFGKANAALANTSGVVFGGQLSVSGNLGIGRAASSLRLDIDGDVRAGGNIIFGDANSDYIQVFGGLITTANNIRIGNTSNVMFIDQQNTRLGINTVSPTNTLDVNGGANVNILFVAGANVGPTLTGLTTNAAAAFGSANTAGTNANNAGTIANSAFGSANQAGVIANAAFGAANSAVGSFAFGAANQAGVIANSAFGAANQSGIIANSAFGTANTSGTSANQAGVIANSAFSKANNALANTSGVSFAGNLYFPSGSGIGLGTTSINGYSFRITNSLTDSTSPVGFHFGGTLQADATGSAACYQAVPNVINAQPFTAGALYNYLSQQGVSFGTGAIINSFVGYGSIAAYAGTNTYSFYSNQAVNTDGNGGPNSTVASMSSSGTTVTVVTSGAHSLTTGKYVTVTATTNATNLRSGVLCRILTPGSTDFTLIGAADNNVGTIFTATGAGTGTGTVTLGNQGSGRLVTVVDSTTFTYTSAFSSTYAAITVTTGTVTPQNHWAFYGAGTAPSYFGGQISIGSTINYYAGLNVAKSLTGNPTYYQILSNGTVLNDVDTSATYVYSGASTQSAAWTLADLNHFYAVQNSFGNGSIVTNQHGYRVQSGLVGATVNYGFSSSVPAAPSGGTATSTVSTIASSGTTTTVVTAAPHGLSSTQVVTVSATAAATALTSGATATILTAGNTDFTLIGAANSSVGTTFTATGAGTGSGTVTINQQGSGKTITVVDSTTFTFTSTTGSYSAITVSSGTVTPTTRWNFYAGGTAPNYFAGNVGIGTTVTSTYKLDVIGSANISLPTLIVAGQNVLSSINNVGSSANTAGTIANAAFGSANTVGTSANTAGTIANAAFDSANTVGTSANTAGTIASGVYFNGALYFPSGNVGIRRTTADYNLDVAGTVNASAIYVNGSPFLGGASVGNEASSGATYYPVFTTTTSGTMTIANVATSALTFIPSSGTLSATVFNSLSDRSLKDDVTPVADALNIVEHLTGVTFTWKSSQLNSYGFIAQDVEKVVPELVGEINNMKTVNYDGIIALLVEAVKELSDKVKELEKKQ